MRTRWTRGLLWLAAALALFGTACGGDGEPGGGGTTSQQTDGDGTTEPTETETDDGDYDDRGYGGVVVTANNFAFTPSEITVASGDEITARNVNPMTPHTFSVRQTDIDVDLAEGSSEDVTIDLDPGEYAFRCMIHDEMTGTLTVT